MSSPEAYALFLTAVRVSAPTYGWVLLGLLLARRGLLSRALNDRISIFSFSWGLPLMLFAWAAAVDYGSLAAARYVLAGVTGTCLALAASWGYSYLRRHPPRQRGIFVQAAYRSNLAIVGLALCVSAYGETGAQLAALPVAVMTALYNILAVWVLNTTLGSGASLLAAVSGILRNPLFLGIAAGAALALSGLPVPGFVVPMGNLLSAVFLPLVLVCIGGAMDISGLRRAGGLAWEASAWRLLVSPLLTVLLALGLGVRGEALGVLFLLVATPVAAASYVMVVAARGDGQLAANIIVISTVCSLLTTTLGLFLLSLLGLVGDLA